jgi:hypothetical protein
MSCTCDTTGDHQMSLELMYLHAPPRNSVRGIENYEKLSRTHPLLKMQSLTKCSHSQKKVSNLLDYLIVPFKIQLQKQVKF